MLIFYLIFVFLLLDYVKLFTYDFSVSVAVRAVVL